VPALALRFEHPLHAATGVHYLRLLNHEAVFDELLEKVQVRTSSCYFKTRMSQRCTRACTAVNEEQARRMPVGSELLQSRAKS
jgi:hypothetical protein